MNQSLLDSPKRTTGVYYSDVLRDAVQEKADRLQRTYNQVAEMSLVLGLPLAYETPDQQEALATFLTLLANPDQVRKISLESRAILALALLGVEVEVSPSEAQARWLGSVGDYVVEEGYPEKYLDALRAIVTGFNYSEEAERFVFACAGELKRIVEADDDS